MNSNTLKTNDGKVIFTSKNKYMSREEEFKAITEKMASVFIAKNKDYGNSFEKSIDEEGYVAFQVRANDKLNRFKSVLLNNKQEVNDESIKDTLLDLANYCIMCSMKISEDLDNKKEVKYY